MGHPGNDSAKSRPSFGEQLSPPAYVEGRVTQVPKAPGDSASETTGTSVRATNFDIAHYRHEEKLLRVHQANNPESTLYDISDDKGSFFSMIFPFVRN